MFRANTVSIFPTLHWHTVFLNGDGEGFGWAEEENNLPRVSYFLIDFPTICIIKNRKTIEGSHCIRNITAGTGTRARFVTLYKEITKSKMSQN